MKIFKKREFACPKSATVSQLDSQGIERIWVCIECRLNDSDTCAGKMLLCENDFHKNLYNLYLKHQSNFTKIKSGKDETLSLFEVEKIAEEYREEYDK